MITNLTFRFNEYWLCKWETSTKFGLSIQTFSVLRRTNNAISDISSDLLSEGFQFVLTGRIQTDALEDFRNNIKLVRYVFLLVSVK